MTEIRKRVIEERWEVCDSCKEPFHDFYPSITEEKRRDGEPILCDACERKEREKKQKATLATIVGSVITKVTSDSGVYDEVEELQARLPDGRIILFRAEGHGDSCYITFYIPPIK